MTVSFIIPCYNYGRFVGAAIESILGQSYPDIELIVIDDGSTDDSSEVISRYRQVKLIRIDNSGISVARNIGTRASRGEFLWFLDADDMLAPGAVESSVKIMAKRPDCAFVYGHESAIGPEGEPLPSYGFSPGKCLAGDLYEQLLAANDSLRSPSAVMHRRRFFESVGGFTDGLRGCEDFDLHLRVLREHEVACNDSIVLIKRIHDENISRRRGEMLEAAVRGQRLQKPFVDQHPQYRAAYSAGLRLARRYNGRNLERQIAEKIVARQKDKLGADLMSLARYAPGRLPLLPARLLWETARRSLRRGRAG